MVDMDFKTGNVLLTGKRAKQRFLHLSRTPLSRASLYPKADRPQPAKIHSDYPFLTVRRFPFTRHTLRCVIDPLAHKMATRATLHMLRNNAATLHPKNRMRLTTLQPLLGHNTITTTPAHLDTANDEDMPH